MFSGVTVSTCNVWPTQTLYGLASLGLLGHCLCYMHILPQRSVFCALFFTYAKPLDSTAPSIHTVAPLRASMCVCVPRMCASILSSILLHERETHPDHTPAALKGPVCAQMKVSCSWSFKTDKGIVHSKNKAQSSFTHAGVALKPCTI